MNKTTLWLTIPLALGLVSACSDDEQENGSDTGGQAGEAGSADRGGSSARGGSATTGGAKSGGAPGSGGAEVMAGAGGDDSGSGGASGGEAGSPDAGSGGMGPEGVPRGPDNPPELGPQIDRMGRPAINTALTEAFSGDDEAKGMAKDAYNAAAPGDWSDFQAEFETSLGILDALDAECGNQLLAGAGGSSVYETLAGVLLDDQLYVNTDKGTCGEYLGVEAEALGLVPDGTCGGRTPNDDVIDRSYSVLAAGVLAGVGDGVDEDDRTHDLDEFPFLAEPQ
jgi:hypothetical protein